MNKILFIFALIFSHIALAWPPTYGAEFEVTRKGLGEFDFYGVEKPSSSPEKQEQMRFVEYTKKLCETAQCTVTEEKGRWDHDYVVKYQDGWWFKISYDPDCIEFMFKPSTREELHRQAQRINEHIFGSAKKLNLEINKYVDNSHFNIGVRSAFNDNAKNFLRFFVDYANHPDLALGSLGMDLDNAPPLSILKDHQKKALQKLIDKVETGKIKTIQDVAAFIQKNIYTNTYNSDWEAYHYQAIGLKHINKTDLRVQDAPMEFRAMWIQDSAENFNLIARLIEGRIKYLNTLNSRIIYTETQKTEFTESELKTRFMIYVMETGLKYEEFESLIPQEVRQSNLDDFIRRDVSIERQLSSIEKYWDLILSSQWARDRVIEILTDPRAKDKMETSKLLEKLNSEATVTIQKDNFYEKLINYFDGFAQQKDLRLEVRREVFRDILEQHKKALSVVNSSPSCPGLFNE